MMRDLASSIVSNGFDVSLRSHPNENVSAYNIFSEMLDNKGSKNPTERQSLPRMGDFLRRAQQWSKEASKRTDLKPKSAAMLDKKPFRYAFNNEKYSRSGQRFYLEDYH